MPDRQGGRPPVGPGLFIRLGEDRKAAIDAYAAQHNLSRAEAVRRLLDAGFRATTSPPQGDRDDHRH